MITLAPSLPYLSPLAPSPRCALAFQPPPPLRSLQRVLQSRPLRLLAVCAAHILPSPRLELRIDVQQPPQSIEAELDGLAGLAGRDTGFCLVSGARQSVGAHALWQALGRRHPLRYVALRQKRMHDLGHAPVPAVRVHLDTRMIMLGRGWSLARLHALGLLHIEAEAANGALRRRA